MRSVWQVLLAAICVLSISAASSGATTRQGSGEAYIVIVKNEQRLYLAQGDPKSPATADVLKQFPVTTGALWTQKGLETPSGYFTIVSKSNSSVQGGYDFSDTGDVTLTPYFMRLDVPNRGGIGIHTYTGRTLDLWRFGATGGETTHGCIAGRPEDIVDLYTNYVVPGETKVWVVDDSSEAFKDKAAPAAPTVSQAGGRAWKSLPSPTKQQFYSVDMVRPDLGWAVSGDVTLIGGKYGWKSQIYKWDGRTWTLDAEVPYWLHGVRMLNENEGWAVGQNYMAGVHYVDGEWTKVDRSIPRVPYMSDVDVLSSDSAWMSGGGAEIFRWDGRTWEVDIEPDVTKTIRAVDLVDEDFGWMVGGGWDTENDAKATISQIAQYDGEGWFPVESPVQELFYGLHAVGRNDAWAVGSNGAIIHWDGSEWRTVPSPTKARLSSVAMNSASDGWAVGDEKGVALHWDGESWTRVKLPVEEKFYEVAAVEGGGAVAVGGAGAIVQLVNAEAAPTPSAAAPTAASSEAPQPTPDPATKPDDPYTSPGPTANATDLPAEADPGPTTAPQAEPTTAPTAHQTPAPQPVATQQPPEPTDPPVSAATTIAPTEVVSAGGSEPDPSPAEPVVSASNGESNAAATAPAQAANEEAAPAEERQAAEPARRGGFPTAQVLIAVGVVAVIGGAGALRFFRR